MLRDNKHKIAEHIANIMLNQKTETFPDNDELFKNWYLNNSTAKDTMGRLTNYKYLQHSIIQRNINKENDAKRSANLLMGKIKRHKKSIALKKVIIGVSSAIASLIIFVLIFNNNISNTTILNNGDMVVAHDSKSLSAPSLVLSSGEVINLSSITSSETRIGSADNVTVSKKEDNSIVLSSNNSKQTMFNIVIPSHTIYNFELPDGTKVFLNANSKLTFCHESMNDNREVTLDGEAYFIVKKSDTKKFVVKSEHMNITVFGTEFNVNTKNKDQIKTVLVSGSLGVRVNNEDSLVMLKPNEHFTYNICSKEHKKGKVDVKNYVSWINNEFNYTNINLTDLLNNISEWYNIKFEYDNEDLAYLNSTCVDICFEMSPNAISLLSAIEQNTELQFIRESNNKFYVKILDK